MRLRVSWHYLSFAVACVWVLTAVPAAAGYASGLGPKDAAHSLHPAHRLETHSTRATLPLQTALFDPFAFGGSNPSPAFAMSRDAGAGYVRIVADWKAIAPANREAGFIARNPASPEYSWHALDSSVAAAEAAGLTPIVDVVSAPRWALTIPAKGYSAGTPSTTALGEFATAIAAHYDGNHGAPVVHVFQIWNEPNVSLYLSPVDAAIYRAMVNAFAGPVHAANRANLVVAGDLDPFGNTAKRFHTMSPLAFLRTFLCVSKGKHPHATCHTPAHFDVWAHHPYTFNGPFGHAGARRPDDVSLGDLPKMRALLRAGVKLHQVVSARPVKFWVTEFSWDTNPPRRHAAPVALEARWTAEALYQMWRSGVSLVTWFLLQDQPSPSPYQSGLYFHAPSLGSARPKPMRTAFRFPFVAYLGKGSVSVWGRDATSAATLVTIQRRHSRRGDWNTIARIRANRYGILKAKLRLRATRRDWLRASAPGSGMSLAFSLTQPSPKLRYGPWGN